MRTAIDSFELRQRFGPSTRAKVRAGVEWFGEATARRRPLPDFLIIGAQKAGTSALYQYLAHHPQVRPAFTKEVHYFDLRPGETERWYRGHFPWRRDPTWITGDATPYYLFHPLVPARAASLLPDAKLIVLLRDPVRRAISHFYHEVALGSETRSLAQAISEEPPMAARETDRIEAGHAPSFAHQHHTYVSRGMYAEQLERWYRYYPARQILVVPAEGLSRDDGDTYGRVLEFLGLEPDGRTEFRRIHSRAYPEPDAWTLDWLEATFDEPNASLGEMLGPDASAFPWLDERIPDWSLR